METILTTKMISMMTTILTIRKVTAVEMFEGKRNNLTFVIAPFLLVAFVFA